MALFPGLPWAPPLLCVALCGPSACVSFDRTYDVEDPVTDESSSSIGTGSDASSDSLTESEDSPEMTDVAVDCPNFCIGGCAGQTCVIECLDPGCKDEEFDCPAGMDCDLVCGEEKSCEGVEFRCSEESSCNVTCSENASCRKTKFICLGAECSTVCEVADACKDLDYECKEDGVCQLERCNDNSVLACEADSSCTEAEGCVTSSDEDEEEGEYDD